MATRLIFEDEENNEMDCFLNEQGKVYIGVGQRDQDMVYNGYITLNKQDVQHLIEILQDCENQMP